jgi:hypothetical protein
MNNNSQQNLDEGWKEAAMYLPYKAKELLGRKATQGIGSAIGGVGRGIASTGEKISDAILKITGGAGRGLEQTEKVVSRDPTEDAKAVLGRSSERSAWPAETSREEVHKAQASLLRQAREWRRSIAGEDSPQLRFKAGEDTKKRDPRDVDPLSRDVLDDIDIITSRVRGRHYEHATQEALKQAKAKVEGRKRPKKAPDLSEKEMADLVDEEVKKLMPKSLKGSKSQFDTEAMSSLPSIFAKFSNKELERRGRRKKVYRSLYTDLFGDEYTSPAEHSTDFESHHGGHGHETSHPDVVAYQEFLRQQKNPALPQFEELFGFHTHHVDPVFFEFVPEDLVKLNKSQRKAFEDSVARSKKLMGSVEKKPAEVPFKIMENKQYDALKGRTKDVYGMRYGGFPRQLNG